MKNQISTVVTGLAVVVLATGAWMVMPSMQSPADVVRAEADVRTERARRMLASYDAHLDVATEMAAQAGLREELSEEHLTDLLENEARLVDQVLEDEEARLDDVFRPSKSRLMALESRLTEMDAGAEIPAHPSSSFGSNVSARARALNQGVSASANLLQDNQRALAVAKQELTEALAASAGEVTGRDSVIANRTHGVTAQQLGAAAQRRANLLRKEADAALFELTSAVARIESLRGQTGLVASSGVDASIAKQRSNVAEVETALGDLSAQVAALQTQIEQRKKDIATQTALADEARAKMEALEAQGVSFDAPEAMERFRRDYEAYAATYRDTVRRAQALEFGTLDNARLDDSGDYLDGAFVPVTAGGKIVYESGLDEFERELSAATAQKQSVEEQLAAARETLARLEGLKEEYATRAADAGTDAQKRGAKVAASFSRYLEVAEQARSAEDEALKHFRQAASAFNAAKLAGDNRKNSAPADLPPEKLDASPYKLIQDDGWLPAQVQCQAGDANIAGALVHLDRYEHATRALTVLDRATQVAPLNGFDRAALATTQAEARSAGVELLEDAINAYERAHRALGSHWTVVASVAAANDLLAQFEQSADREEVARANYQNVVKGREDEPFVKPYLDRLNQIRNR